MKPFTNLSILFLLSLISLTTTATSFQNGVTCGKRFHRINTVIEAFCRYSDNGGSSNGMVVPSEYARQGVGFTGTRGNRFIVAVEATCNPPMWLPYKWCVAQFNEMCANTKNPWGYHTQRFGPGGCQKFIIGPRSTPGWITKPNVPS